MKLSIAWIFYHIDADWKKIDIKYLVDKFNKTTAEIESYKKIQTDLGELFLAKISSISQETVILFCHELNKEIELPKRENIKENDLFLLRKNKDTIFQWARSTDLGSEKDFILPKFSIEEKLLNGEWKKSFEYEDYIFEVDNKSITHRPDLWGHRGFAREIAAILGLPLLPIQKYIEEIKVFTSGNSFKASSTNAFSSSIDSQFCKRFATYYINDIENKSSNLFTSTRLLRIDAKPINAIVDATNYVMFDLGQPMHAFDAKKIKGKNISARLATKGEKLTLLDGENIELTENDLVIADEENPIALAGIMGGKNTEVDENTKSVLIESANFDAATIRKSSIRFKKRTEASARFEKSLDPNQNIPAIERYLKILNLENVQLKASNEIVSLGHAEEEKKIEVSLNFIQARLGVAIEAEFVKKTLEKLEFKVTQQNDLFKITVPTFRCIKDVTIPEDIVEEVGRFFGYGNIPFVLPAKQMIPTDFNEVVNLRKIKELMAFSGFMHEVQNYPFYDESFLIELKWQPENTIYVSNPVSENWRRLVTSLIPHLIKNVQQNLTKSEELNFFEFNRIWQSDDSQEIEKKSLSGIFFSKNEVDFYEAKKLLITLFELLDITVTWSKSNNVAPWYSKFQTADLMFNNKKIGTAGKISKEFLSKITEGEAFIFELDGNFLVQHKSQLLKFKPLGKYPSVWLDISMFIPINVTVDEVGKIIKISDSRIFKVDLVDRFVKDEWNDKVSLTFRFHILDEQKTLLKEEINEIMNNVTNQVKKLGAQLR